MPGTHPLDNHCEHMGKPYALIGHVRFDKGEAMRVVSLLYVCVPGMFTS